MLPTEKDKKTISFNYQIFKTKSKYKLDIYQDKKLIETVYKDNAIFCLAYALEIEAKKISEVF